MRPTNGERTWLTWKHLGTRSATGCASPCITTRGTAGGLAALPLGAVIVSAGLLMTAFPFASPNQLAHVGGSVLLATAAFEVLAAARRRTTTTHVPARRTNG
ncbi:hypothetical protein [Streptomyces sp. YU58]|uniref:hypothetical protein n=1 Tax=Streptomyces sp. SX92 TaxID=3158972 RepID=UPI0027BA88FA|nr:hypothetical protein [Streptomyces coralus]WLW57276.1 hypothetical protein QU709_40550 [Streptomyces coralus]